MSRAEVFSLVLLFASCAVGGFIGTLLAFLVTK
jgi:hypothetical protein